MKSDLFSLGATPFGVSRVRLSTLDVRLCGMLRELGGAPDLAEPRAALVAISMRVDASSWQRPIVRFALAAYQYVIGLASHRLGEGLRFPAPQASQLETMLMEASVRADAGMRKNLAKLAIAIGTLQVSADRAA